MLKSVLPITISNDEELKEFIILNSEYISTVLDSVDKNSTLENELKLQKEKNRKLEDEKREIVKSAEKERARLKELANLSEKKHGDHSMYKGEFEEKNREQFLSEYFGKRFTICGDKRMRCMDIRMTNILKKYIIGIECKHKKSIANSDITKFKRDKLTNKFKGCIFLSIGCAIGNILQEVNSCKIVNDEFYIYSNDEKYIYMAIEIFIGYLESESTENKISIKYYVDHIQAMHKNWEDTKAFILKQDRYMVNSIEKLRKLGVNINTRGHLYITSKNNCKSKKAPY